MDYTNRAAVSQAVLDFIYQLPNGYSNFPEHVLKLLAKYFHQHTLAFIPTNINFADLRKQRPDYFVRDYVTLNVPPEHLTDYNRYYYSKDIFRYASLPPDLRRKPVITVEDIMPYHEYRQTEYYMYLQRNGTPHQAIINLNHDDIYLGAIAMYQTEEEGPVTPEQVEIYKTLNRFIVQHYVGAMKASGRSSLLNMFKDDGFRDLTLGVMVLNEAYTVLEANSMAQRYAADMLRTTAPDFVHKTVQGGGNKRFPNAQQIINNLGHGMFLRGEPVGYPCGDCCYQFHTSSIIAPSESLSKLETLYIVFISVSERKSSGNPLLYKELTAREAEIVEWIAKGYTNTQIAEEMHISVHTVKTHILNIFKKQGVSNRTALLHKLHQSTI